MNDKHLLLKELNNALKQYYNGNGQKSSYNVLFSPLQKANKVLLENNIDIFNLKQEKNLFDENLNGLGKLLTSSIKARNIILENNFRLIKKIANKYAQKVPQLECNDLESEGVFGLLKAIEKHKPDLNMPFSHFASPVIDNHLKQNLNKYLRTITFPINFVFDYARMIKFEDEFKQKFTRKPNDEELAEFMHKPVKYVTRLNENNNKLYHLVCLDIPAFRESIEDHLIDTILDSHSSPIEDRVVNKITFKDSIQDYISKLPERQQEVLLKRLKNKTFTEIAVCAGEENLMITKSKKILTKQRIEVIYSEGVRKARKLNALKNI